MRTREKSYEDYGITKEDIKKIKKICRDPTIQEKEIIETALSELDSYISFHVLRYLSTGKSYEKLCGEQYIYLAKNDFYSKCRQAMDAIKRWMILYGIWEI